MGRRPVFFGVLCLIGLLLIPFTPAEYRGVNLLVTGLSLFWAIAVGIEDVLRARSSRKRDEGRDRPLD